MIEIIRQRFEQYQPQDPYAADQVLREIMQEVALYSLWRADFFSIAAFQGGTSLRILHQLPRFSEDLDFILKHPSDAFSWEKYQEPVLDSFTEFGFNVSVLSKSQMDKRVRQAVVKGDSIVNQLTLAFPLTDRRPDVKIKLEIDINPPEFSDFTWSYLDYPLDFEVCHQDLSSNFALKLHALLCRPYLKGRDWFDFSWYVSRKVQPNYPHLQAALLQYGPWENQPLQVDVSWLKQQLSQKVTGINWQEAKQDVERFLSAPLRRSLDLWSADFFNHKIDKL